MGSWKNNNVITRASQLRESERGEVSIQSILNNYEYVNIGRFYAFTDSECYEEVLEFLDNKGIKYQTEENSYVGLYAIKIG